VTAASTGLGAASHLLAHVALRFDRIAASYVDQILKGAKAGDLPIRHPDRYFLTINLRAAERIGLTLPADFVAAADRVIR
jgi:ABC-type uncharacterized transport system substrate-binding protein